MDDIPEADLAGGLLFFAEKLFPSLRSDANGFFEFLTPF
jgi:hypothetical protein